VNYGTGSRRTPALLLTDRHGAGDLPVERVAPHRIALPHYGRALGMAVDVPVGLERGRHVEMSGRGRHVWQRRTGLMLATCIPLLALLNVFGQRAHPILTSAPAASLSVNSPSRVRGGLIFTSEFIITPHTKLHDVQLRLNDGWFKSMTVNGSEPQPTNESAQGDWQIFDYGPMPAGIPYTIFISWQTNPTNVGRHSQDVALDNGNDQILAVQRSITVFP
jgi:hypothetical protein